MTKRKVRKFRVHAALDVTENRRLELMFNSTLETVKIRAVVDGIPQRPYTKSEILSDEQGAFFMLWSVQGEDELAYTKIYLDNFRRVRG